MRNFTASILNAITDNLRNRYDDGFPILKELIQNADDARADHLVFGRHPGFPHSEQPLLRGPGLWFWNDGEIKDDDIDALCSFGINAKARDSDTIGKFGLGMKSVFHLCEAFFFLAWNGNDLTNVGLSPWDPAIHPAWERMTGADWEFLNEIGVTEWKNRDDRTREDWFLLWIPLRQERHLITPQGRTGSIIERFPGDNPKHDLEFLTDSELPLRLAEILPLLHHLERIEFRGDEGKYPAFTIHLQAQQRLERHAKEGQAQGWVEVLSGKASQRLSFTGQKHESADDWFKKLRNRPDWPRTYVRNNVLGREVPAPEKARPEAAVLFARAQDANRLTLRWAVFLPLTKGEEQLHTEGKQHFRITLHGQFFIDSGRKGIRDLERLHEVPPRPDAEVLDDASLQWAWNARLFQRVLAPSFLPALNHFVVTESLDDRDCQDLTSAIARTDLFTRHEMRQFFCADVAWCRVLEPEHGGNWKLISGAEVEKLRPMPMAPANQLQCLWQTFPELAPLDVIPYDRGAPRLMDRERQWSEAEVEKLLASAKLDCRDQVSMSYLASYLDDEYCAAAYRSTIAIQGRLIGLLRHALSAAGVAQRGPQRDKSTQSNHLLDLAKRLIDFINPENRLALAAEIPDPWLAGLLGIETACLLVPKGFEPYGRPGKATPDDKTLALWLQYIHRVLKNDPDEKSMESLLDVVKGLLKSIDDQARVAFLRLYPELSILAVDDCRLNRKSAVSLREIEAVREAGTLFDYAVRDRQSTKTGFAPLLGRALPDARIWLIQSEGLRELFPASSALPKADSPRACLVAVGRYSGKLGIESHRRALLERAFDPGNDPEAIQGLRLLLHGSCERRLDTSTTLWVPRQNQHSAWRNLWTQLHSQDEWAIIPREIAGCIPSNHWKDAGIEEIDGPALLRELQASGRGIPRPGDLVVEERDEILSQIDDRALWQRLPLHTNCRGEPVSIANIPAWLAPDGGCPDDGIMAGATIIRRSENALQAKNQTKPGWLKPLDDQALIEIGITAEQPECHWQIILDALGRLPTPVLSNLPVGFRQNAWLPGRFGSVFAPEDVLNLPGNLRDQTEHLVIRHREIQKAGGHSFAVPDDLDERLTSHPAYDRLSQYGFSHGKDGLAGLALLLERLPEYAIGIWPRKPSPGVIELMADCPELPGWQLLHLVGLDAFDAAEAWHGLEAGLCQELSPDRLIQTLDWTSQTTTNWVERKEAHDAYLRQLNDGPVTAQSVHVGLRLATRARTWGQAGDLCAGAVGIEGSRVLDDQQAKILGAFIQRMDKIPASDAGTSRITGTAGFKQSILSAPGILKHYFEPWGGGLVAAPMIGVVLALLGPGVRELAKTYLHPHSFDWLLQDSRLPWRDPGRDGLKVHWMGLRTLVEALNLIEAAFHEEHGDQVDGINLFGQVLRLPLETQVKTLIAGALRWKGGYRVEIPLRRINPARFQPDKLAEILRGTAEELYRQLYNQQRPDFRPLWQELDRTDQLEIKIAHRLILQHIPFYLRQLSLHTQVLHEALNNCDAAGRLVAEQEEAGKPVSEKARQQEFQALLDLGNQLYHNDAAQAEVLAAVKRKIGDYQYKPGSIPFELFQNADDAAVELGIIQAFPAEYEGVVPDNARRFLVEANVDTLRFLHWGRTVNDRGPAGFDGDRRGFGRDLEKMLVLSASDKIGGDQVTGRLGLGFKSVLLACDCPRILSGRLAVEIVAGILPRRWDNCDQARASLSRNRGGDPPLPGTLIELPGITAQIQPEVLNHFRRLAGILCCFGRVIRTIQMQPGDHFAWQPANLGNLLDPLLEFGRIRLPDKEWGVETHAICLRTPRGSLLMGMGPRGFRALPDDVPAIWVTAPTREESRTGFAINGPFALDPGRARLDASNEANRQIARSIGADAGDLLAGLLEKTRNHWESVRGALRLDDNLAPAEFWLGIWLGLTKRSLVSNPDAAVDLARETIRTLFERLSQNPAAVPNGLPRPAQSMILSRGINYELSSKLATPELVQILTKWPRFIKSYPLETVVAEPIGAILKASLRSNLHTVTPVTLLSLITNQQVEPEDARVLGQIIEATQERIDWEEKTLDEKLKNYYFRTEAGNWAKAAKLLILTECRKDHDFREEALRYDIAPPERRIHSDYFLGVDGQKEVLELFLSCRNKMDAPLDDLAKWILGAKEDAQKQSSLRLLVRTNQPGTLCALVRGKDWLDDVLNNQKLLNEAGLSASECNELWRLLPSNAQVEQFRFVLGGQEIIQSISWSIDINSALKRIQKWWDSNRTQYNYRNKLYPTEINLREIDKNGRYDRSAWLTLFALGAFQSLPWNNDASNRRFLEICRDKGWWDTFSDKDPLTNPEEWMDIIGKYAESQTNDQEWFLWIGQFTNLYRLRRWLDDYRELFLSIDRFNKAFSLDNILLSKASNTYQGGGIDAPPINRTLNKGVHLVIRELLYYGILKKHHAIPHAYAPISRIVNFFQRFNVSITTSQDIYKLLENNLDSNGACFHGDYDIPLRIVAGDEDLQHKLFSI